MNNLRYTALNKAKRSPQYFMAVEQIAQALLQDLNIERPDDAISPRITSKPLDFHGG